MIRQGLFLLAFLATGLIIAGCGEVTSGNYNPPESIIEDWDKYVADTQAVRAILDSNQLFSTSYLMVTGVNRTGRIDSLFPIPGTIKRIPASLGNLTEMKYIVIYNNDSLTSLPPEIGLLTKLQFLKVHRNSLRALPDQICNCTLLVQLYIFDNELISLPQNIGQLSRLSTLEASGNQLAALPNSISQLQTPGTWVHVGQNKLCSLPDPIASWLNEHSYDPDWAALQTGCTP